VVDGPEFVDMPPADQVPTLSVVDPINAPMVTQDSVGGLNVLSAPCATEIVREPVREGNEDQRSTMVASNVVDGHSLPGPEFVATPPVDQVPTLSVVDPVHTPMVIEDSVAGFNVVSAPSATEPAREPVSEGNEDQRSTVPLPGPNSPIEVVRQHPLVCENCLVGFDYPVRLTEHQSSVQCVHLPCKSRVENHLRECAPVNLAFTTRDGALAHLKLHFPNYSFNEAKKDCPNRTKKCKFQNSHGCKAGARVQATRRYTDERTLVEVYAVLGCQAHSHSPNLPIRGYCTGQHTHQCVDLSFPNLPQAKEYSQGSFCQQKFNTLPRKDRHTIQYVCAKRDCPANVMMDYKKNNDVQVRGCMNHTHELEIPSECGVDHTHIRVDEQFSTINGLQTFVYDNELDASFRLSQSYSTKVTNVRSYICGRRGWYLAQKTTKKNTNCPAFFKTFELEGGGFKIEGCLEHTHPIELRFLKVSRKDVDKVVHCLTNHIPVKTIKDKFFPFTDYENNLGKPVLQDDIRRIKRLTVPEPDTIMLKDGQASVETMKKEEIRAFNLRKILINHDEDIPASIAEKIVEVAHDQILVFYMSEKQREYFRESPYNLLTDGMFVNLSSKCLGVSIIACGSQQSCRRVFLAGRYCRALLQGIIVGPSGFAGRYCRALLWDIIARQYCGT
jgi:hypothetical protein